MSDYKLIAFDMDGTLLNSEKKIPQENIEAIDKAVKAGKIVVYSTGRCLPELEDYIATTPQIRYANCLSGACVYDTKAKKTIFSAYIDEKTALKIIELVEGRDVMIEFLDDRLFIQKSHFENIEKYGMGVYRDLYDKKAIKVENVIDFYRKNPYPLGKLNIFHKSSEDREITNKIIRKNNIKVSMAYAETTSFETCANGVDKGIGLEKLCEHLGIDIKDTIAVGDADNDIGIFKKAGLKIAMNNANVTIKGLSDVVVPDCDNGGCVVAIEKYLL